MILLKKVFTMLLSFMLLVSLGGCKKDVKSISLDKSTLTVEQEQKFNLTATILPSDATNKELAWSVDGDAVSALTDENSTQKEFVGNKSGKSTIKVIASNGSVAECVVNVVAASDDSAENTEQTQNEQAVSNDTGKTTKGESQYIIDGNVKVKLKNTIPATIKQYSFADGSVQRTYEITKVQTDGNAIYVSGTKLSDKSGNEFGCKIKWQLYDDSGAVVTSDWNLSPATAVGESWANVNIRFNAGSLPAGVYTLQFCDSD